MLNAPFYMVFDVESIGLHGEGYAVGWVVLDNKGEEIEAILIDCPPEHAKGSRSGRRWIFENAPVLGRLKQTPAEVRDAFWSRWLHWKAKGALLIADCGWPVEARFLAACVDDDPTRCWEGPYPLHELASIIAVLGGDPLAVSDRKENELPVHDPLADARNSARLLSEAFLMRSLFPHE